MNEDEKLKMHNKKMKLKMKKKLEMKIKMKLKLFASGEFLSLLVHFYLCFSFTWCPLFLSLFIVSFCLSLPRYVRLAFRLSLLLSLSLFLFKKWFPHEEKSSIFWLLFCLGPLLCLRNMYVATVLVTNPMIGSFMSFSDGVS